VALISDKAMQALPGAKDDWIVEDGARGSGRLLGRISPSGARSFYFRYAAPSGKRDFLPIGPYDQRGDGKSSFTVKQARGRASELSALYRSGIRDLRGHLAHELEDQRLAQEARRRAGDEAARAAAQLALEQSRRLTVRKLFDQWQRAELTPQTLADGTRIGRKDAGAWVKASFERRVFPTLGELPAETAKRADLLGIVDACKAEGHRRTANVLFADLRQMFRFATEREIVARNPLDGLKRDRIGGKDVERDRVLEDAELLALWAAVPEARMQKRSAAAIWLILSTACRVGEAMSARWENVDLERRTWYLPDTKNQRDHTIHLSEFALRQMKAILAERETEPNGKPVPWLFANLQRNGPVHVKSFGKQLADRQRPADKQMKNRSRKTESLALAGGRWTAHDLRRTAATLMARLGIGNDVIDECLNHKLQSKVARIYIQDRRQAEQVRAFDALGRRLLELFEGRAGSQVVPLPSRAIA
jgi:integrase